MPVRVNYICKDHKHFGIFMFCTKSVGSHERGPLCVTARDIGYLPMANHNAQGDTHLLAVTNSRSSRGGETGLISVT